jgi:hypothetical protein
MILQQLKAYKCIFPDFLLTHTIIICGKMINNLKLFTEKTKREAVKEKCTNDESYTFGS